MYSATVLPVFMNCTVATSTTLVLYLPLVYGAVPCRGTFSTRRGSSRGSRASCERPFLTSSARPREHPVVPHVELPFANVPRLAGPYNTKIIVSLQRMVRDAARLAREHHRRRSVCICLPDSIGSANVGIALTNAASAHTTVSAATDDVELHGKLRNFVRAH
jgi:hypothetical protein